MYHVVCYYAHTGTYFAGLEVEKQQQQQSLFAKKLNINVNDRRAANKE